MMSRSLIGLLLTSACTSAGGHRHQTSSPTEPSTSIEQASSNEYPRAPLPWRQGGCEFVESEGVMRMKRIGPGDGGICDALQRLSGGQGS